MHIKRGQDDLVELLRAAGATKEAENDDIKNGAAPEFALDDERLLLAARLGNDSRLLYLLQLKDGPDIEKKDVSVNAVWCCGRKFGT